MRSLMMNILKKVRFSLHNFWKNVRYIIMHHSLFQSLSKRGYKKLELSTFSQVLSIKKMMKKIISKKRRYMFEGISEKPKHWLPVEKKTTCNELQDKGQLFYKRFFNEILKFNYIYSFCYLLFQLLFLKISTGRVPS